MFALQVRVIVMTAIKVGREFKMEQPIIVRGRMMVVQLAIAIIVQLPSTTAKLVSMAIC